MGIVKVHHSYDRLFNKTMSKSGTFLSDSTDSEYDDSEDDLIKETVYTSPQDCTQQLQNWTQKSKFFFLEISQPSS